MTSRFSLLEHYILKIYTFFLLILGGGRTNMGDLQMQLPLFDMVQPQSKIPEYKMGLYVCAKYVKRVSIARILAVILWLSSKCTICDCVLSHMGAWGGVVVKTLCY
jgi:hypothetical protein